MSSRLTVLRCPQRRQGDLFAAPAAATATAGNAPRGPQSIWASRAASNTASSVAAARADHTDARHTTPAAAVQEDAA